jgi:hypothetical protein
MTGVGTRDIPLKWDVFVTPGIPSVTSDLPPGAKQRLSVPRRRPKRSASTLTCAS